MSPEQSLGQPTDARSDLFSLGVLCHELIAGRSPFVGRDLHDTLHRVRALTPPPLHELEPSVPRSLSQLIQRLLAKSPGDREVSAEKVLRALEAIVNQSDRTSAAPAGGRGERRQVVLVAVELALAPGSDDPELLLQFRRDYRSTLERAVDELGGSVHSAVGQQYMLCFGYPEPHEDSARRGALAALQIRDWSDSLGRRAGVTVRVALHAGTAVILGHGGESELEVGSLLRTVQGLRDLSPEAEVLASDAACQHLAGVVQGRMRIVTGAEGAGHRATLRQPDRACARRRRKNRGSCEFWPCEFWRFGVSRMSRKPVTARERYERRAKPLNRRERDSSRSSRL